VTEVPPAARIALDALAAAPGRPAKLLLVGGIGTGKTAALTAAREVLHDAGVTVMTGPPGHKTAGTAVVVDDADELSATELAELADYAADPDTTVIAGAQPREHLPELRSFAAALERHQPRIRLGPLSRTDVDRRMTLASADLDEVMAETAGLPFLVAAADVQAALTDRLRRLDEQTLSALLIMSLAGGLGPADIGAALALDDASAWDLADRCHATGLLDTVAGERLTAEIHQVTARLIGAVRHREIESALLRTQIESSTVSTELGLALADHGYRDRQLATFLEQQATDRHTEHTDSIRLLRAALDAQPDTTDAAIMLRLADASARNGDCAGATALTDGLLDSPDGANHAVAVRIAASVAAHDGNTAQAVELFEWLGRSAHDPADELTGAAGAVVFVAAGAATAAQHWLAQSVGGAPTSTAHAARSLAIGTLATLDQPYAVAAARLGQAIGPDIRAALPDSPAALLTLSALHNGDPARARSVSTRALAGEDPAPAFVHRHRLLLAWNLMQEGQLAAADVPDSGLHRRDALWAAALHTAIARRTGDTGALQQHWFAAMEVLAEYSVDLFSLLPLGELWVAAARLHQVDRIIPMLDQAFALLRALDSPPTWSLPLHWAGVHAAILSNSPEAMAPHGRALTAAAAGAGPGTNGFAAALAAGGRAWLRVLASQGAGDDGGAGDAQDATMRDVVAAARGLAQYGLTWDATRLAGQAALQTPDPRVSGVMLQLARDLKLGAPAVVAATEPQAPANEGAGRSVAMPRAPASATALSDREREVAELLLLGLPYRDIGSQLFISAKTVEHHVARIRRRLGAQSRSEMLSMLRAILAPAGVPQS
jgi:DNA-binding CsgD family transcriptional regulator